MYGSSVKLLMMFMIISVLSKPLIAHRWIKVRNELILKNAYESGKMYTWRGDSSEFTEVAYLQTRYCYQMDRKWDFIIKLNKMYILIVQFQSYIKIISGFGAFLFVSKNCFSWISKIHLDMKRTLYECLKKSSRIQNMHITWDMLIYSSHIFLYYSINFWGIINQKRRILKKYFEHSLCHLGKINRHIWCKNLAVVLSFTPFSVRIHVARMWTFHAMLISP